MVAVVGSTPSFLGANPAVVPSGPTAGSAHVAGEEGLARELLSSLSPAQRDVAVVDPVAPPDILTGNSARADARSVPRGIRYDDLDGAGRQGLERLIRHYLGRAIDRVAEADWRVGGRRRTGLETSVRVGRPRSSRAAATTTRSMARAC